MVVPYLSNDEIERRAEEFLSAYLPTRTIPVPIEESVEVDMEVEIVPIPGFAARFAVEGYISNDLETLFIDEGTMQRKPARYRFTLAHEISHYLLHGDYIRQEFPGNPHDWKQRLLKRDAKLHTRLAISSRVVALNT